MVKLLLKNTLVEKIKMLAIEIAWFLRWYETVWSWKLYIFELELHSMLQEHSRKTQQPAKTKKPKTTTISQKSKPTINEPPHPPKKKKKKPSLKYKVNRGETKSCC